MHIIERPLSLLLIGEEVASIGDPKLDSTFGLREAGMARTCTISPLCPCLLSHPDPVPTAEKSGRRRRRRAWPAQEARKAGGRGAAATPAPPRGRGPAPSTSLARHRSPAAQCPREPSFGRRRRRPARARARRGPERSCPACEPHSTVLVSAGLRVPSSAAAEPLVPGCAAGSQVVAPW